MAAACRVRLGSLGIVSSVVFMASCGGVPRSSLQPTAVASPTPTASSIVRFSDAALARIVDATYPAFRAPDGTRQYTACDTWTVNPSGAYVYDNSKCPFTPALSAELRQVMLGDIGFTRGTSLLVPSLSSTRVMTLNPASVSIPKGAAAVVRVQLGTSRFDLVIAAESGGRPVVADVWGNMAVSDSGKCISLLNDSALLTDRPIPASSVEPFC